MKPAVARLLCCSLLAVGLLSSCEDDPILEPSQEKPGGGSYGILTIDSTQNEVPDRVEKPNPALF